MASYPFSFSNNLCLANHLPHEATFALILELLLSCLNYYYYYSWWPLYCQPSSSLNSSSSDHRQHLFRLYVPCSTLPCSEPFLLWWAETVESVVGSSMQVTTLPSSIITQSFVPSHARMEGMWGTCWRKSILKLEAQAKKYFWKVAEEIKEILFPCNLW